MEARPPPVEAIVVINPAPYVTIYAPILSPYAPYCDEVYVVRHRVHATSQQVDYMQCSPLINNLHVTYSHPTICSFFDFML